MSQQQINAIPSGVFKLGAVELTVDPLPLGQLRRLIPTFNRVGRAFSLGTVDDTVIDGLVEILSIATGKTTDELAAMPCDYGQLMYALQVVSEVSGLKQREGAQGEALPGATASSPA